MLWTNEAGQLIVNGNGQPMDCEACPCASGVPIQICPGGIYVSQICVTLTPYLPSHNCTFLPIGPFLMTSDLSGNGPCPVATDANFTATISINGVPGWLLTLAYNCDPTCPDGPFLNGFWIRHPTISPAGCSLCGSGFQTKVSCTGPDPLACVFINTGFCTSEFTDGSNPGCEIIVSMTSDLSACGA